MKEIFLIAVGGTGAKVAEAYIHLCAAGLGPESAHILLIDVDQDNGNLLRTRTTLEQYAKLANWPWAAPGEETHFFRTKLGLHVLVEKLRINNRGGLRSHTVTPPGFQAALDLFYDEAEQTATHEKGFLAKPNLGSLVMDGHLSDCFTQQADSEWNQAPGFLAALREAIARGENVPVVVVGSIFGGTGASVFPVIQNCLKNAMAVNGNTPEMRHQQAVQAMARVDLCGVLMLPYFTPEGCEPDGTLSVDPSRFLQDTSNALKHYGSRAALAGFRRLYLVGSDNPKRYVIDYQSGSKAQTNPPMFEEFIAGTAILHLQETAGAQGVFAYRPSQENPTLRWDNLPWAPARKSRSISVLRGLIHLAAFYLYEGSTDSLSVAGWKKAWKTGRLCVEKSSSTRGFTPR